VGIPAPQEGTGGRPRPAGAALVGIPAPQKGTGGRPRLVGAALAGIPAPQERTSGRPCSAGAALAGVPSLQEHIFSSSPLSYEEGDIKAIPAKHTCVKFYIWRRH
jgi:hypothetical protein